ncbi:MAG: hypothetical protein HON04_13750 [Planctomicrobium sp.]|jgi:hypothetical protein|nr:hypothetical protein [Planctomicrobium sp.]
MKPFLVFSMMLLLTTSSYAQSNRDQRRDFVESLLQSLIESQVDQRRPNRGNQNIPISQELNQVRTIAGTLADQMGQLVMMLRIEERNMPQLRLLLAQTIESHAKARVLVNRASVSRNHNEIVNEVMDFDQGWRVVAHRLKQVPGMGWNVLRAVDEITELDSQVRQILQIQPAYDRSSLLRLASNLSTTVGHLNQELRYQLHRNPNRNQIYTLGYQLKSETDQYTFAVNQGSYDALVIKTKSLQKSWKAFSNSMRDIESERLQRDILEVEETVREMSELLSIPVEIDRNVVLRLSQSIEHEFDLFLETVTLLQLLEVVRPQVLIAKADEFHHAAHDFAHAVETTQQIDEIAWDFQILEVQWNEFQRLAQSLPQATAQRHLQLIQQSLDVLKHSLHMQPELDRRELLTLTASIDNLADQLAVDGERFVVGSATYQPAFRSQFKQQLHEFHEAAHHLHDAFVQSETDRQIQQDAKQVISSWNAVKQSVSQLRQQEQQRLLQTIAQIEPGLVKLQVLFY